MTTAVTRRDLVAMESLAEREHGSHVDLGQALARAASIARDMADDGRLTSETRQGAGRLAELLDIAARETFTTSRAWERRLGDASAALVRISEAEMDAKYGGECE